MTTTKQRERDEAIASLREILKPGGTVFTVLRHVSRSGMARDIDLYVFQDNEPRWLSSYAARAIGATMHNDAVRVGGCGMDMGFHLVYSLSRTLFPDGFDCIGDGGKDYSKRCPSNDHSNDRGASDLVTTERGTMVGRWSPKRHHKDGGYALRHRWLG